VLQIVFIVQTNLAIVVIKIKGVYADISKMSVALSQNLNVNTARNI